MLEDFLKKSSLRKMHLKFKSYISSTLPALLFSEISPNWNQFVHCCRSIVIWVILHTCIMSD